MKYTPFQIQAARNTSIQEFDKTLKFATTLPLKVGDLVIDSFRRPALIYSIEDGGFMLKSASTRSLIYGGMFKHGEVRLATPHEINEIMSYEKPVKTRKTRKVKGA